MRSDCPDVTILPESKCPECGGKLDAVTGAEPGTSPEPGDVSVCFNCGELLEFVDELQLIALRDETIADMTKESMAQLLSIQHHIRNRVTH